MLPSGDLPVCGPSDSSKDAPALRLRIETLDQPKEWNQVRVFGSWMGWQAFDGYSHTACGTVEGFRPYCHPFPRDKDWNLGLTRLSVGRYLIDDTKALVGCPRSPGSEGI